MSSLDTFLNVVELFLGFVFAAAAGFLAFFVTVLVLFGVPLSIFEEFELRRLRKRHASNQCIQCGYPLAGLSGIVRCPECGSH